MRDETDGQDCVIALDVGGTSMKGAVLDRNLKVLHAVRMATPRRWHPDAVVAEIIAVLHDLNRAAIKRELSVRGAGVVVPGIVDESTQTAIYSANLGWRDLPLAALLEDASGLPVTLGHDVRAGGVAECCIGAARNAQDVWFVPIGTGISAAVFCDGQLVRAGGYAGELGHIMVEPGGKPCACGARGCLEGIASASAVAAAYSARSGLQIEGAATVAERLAQGDPDARAVWDRAVEALATALTTATTLFAPEVIVLGGGLAEAGGLLMAPLRTSLARQLTFQRRPKLVLAELGDMAGCLGAGLAALQAASCGPSPHHPRKSLSAVTL
ncbi:ROK family protein [Streptomyces sp. HMX112]|uniref:ROK family protein n=1 Tax=Streptomyces sp. HMX112 TaxID=3390850 RepID=UPI003A7FABC9